MKTTILNNGVSMPVVGYGTYQTPPRLTEACVAAALSAGYLSIDTAQCYGNEREVGLACRRSGIARERLFITTKLWGCRGYSDTLRSIDASLNALDLGYIDLLLIHEPSGDTHEIYRAMETAYGKGLLRAIGVSNFLEERYLDLTRHCTVIPAVNQVETASRRSSGSWNSNWALSMKAGRRWPAGVTAYISSPSCSTWPRDMRKPLHRLRCAFSRSRESWSFPRAPIRGTCGKIWIP